MNRNSISTGNITSNGISWHRLAAFPKFQQNIVYSLYNDPGLGFFLFYATDDLVEKRVFRCLGFRFLDKFA